MNGIQTYIPTWPEKIGWVLFPARHICAPETTFSKDVLVNHVTINLSIVDRIRILLTGRISVVTKTSTENVIGKHHTDSTCHVLPPRFLER